MSNHDDFPPALGKRAEAYDDEQYRRELIRYVCRLSEGPTKPILNYEDAEDVVQETFLRAWMYRHTYKPDTNRRAWLFSIAKNAYMDAYGEIKKFGTATTDDEMAVAAPKTLPTLKKDQPKPVDWNSPEPREPEYIQVGKGTAAVQRSVMNEQPSAEDEYFDALGPFEREAIRRRFDGLPDGVREVVELWLDGLRGPEIAEVLGVSLPTVKWRVREARRLLGEAV